MTEPPITIRARYSSFTAGDNANPTRVVIHATCPNVGYSAASAPGAAHGTALYFASPAAGGSAHYVCGVDGEEHCVPDDTIAYHAPPNAHSLGIEITAEGGQYPRNYTREQWTSPQVWPAVQRAAARCRDLCQRYGIPMVKLSPADLLAGKHGICGHVDVSQAWHQSTHSDPGPNFPWDLFMAEVSNPTPEDDMTPDEVKALLSAVASIQTTVADPTGGVLVRVANLQRQVAALAAASDPKALAAAIAAALPQNPGSLSEADVETALRKVLGSLDNAS